jgi:hypothetical protein
VTADEREEKQVKEEDKAEYNVEEENVTEAIALNASVFYKTNMIHVYDRSVRKVGSYVRRFESTENMNTPRLQTHLNLRKQ